MESEERMTGGCRATGDIRLPGAEGKVGVVLGLLLLAGSVAAQEPGASYHPLQLDCASYRQQVHSVIDLEGGRQRSRETTGRDGVLKVRASAQDSLLRLEAWFDTLTVWREGSGERMVPETDGVIGGRFKGLLTRSGVFTSVDRPFVPMMSRRSPMSAMHSRSCCLRCLPFHCCRVAPGRMISVPSSAASPMVRAAVCRWHATASSGGPHRRNPECSPIRLRFARYGESLNRVSTNGRSSWGWCGGSGRSR